MARLGNASVSIRPTIVYGQDEIGEELSANDCNACGIGQETLRNTISGSVSYVYVEDAALRFINAVTKPFDGAFVFDLDGTPLEIEEVISLIKSCVPDAQISFKGDVMPFPADADNGKLNAFWNFKKVDLLLKELKKQWQYSTKREKRVLISTNY